MYNIILTVIVLVILGTFKVQIANLFTQEPKTVTIIDDVIHILLVYIFFDTIHGV